MVQNKDRPWAEILDSVKSAPTIRELMNDEVEGYLWENGRDAIAISRAESDLREIAKQGRFLKNFESEIRAIKSEIRRSIRESDEAVKNLQREKNDSEDKIKFDYLDNPCPALRSFSYSVRDNGIFRGDEQICTQPILVSGKYVDIESGESFLTLTYHDGYEWHTVTEKREVLFSATRLVQLAAFGLSVHTANAAAIIRFLDCFEAENRLALIPRKSYSRLGWLGNGAFAPFTPDLVFAGRENQDLYSNVTTSGTLDQWKAVVSPLRKNLQLRLTMGASFASVLIEKAGCLPFVFHLWGPSGTGKSVGLMVAASIWGNPEFGKLIGTLNATKNFIVNRAAFFNSIPVFLDELQVTGSQYEGAESLIMTLCEGIDRGRMEFAKSQKTASWRCAFLSTGEGPITKAGDGGGTINRVIEVECQNVIEDGNTTANAVREHYGHAGKIFADNIRNIDIPSLFREQQADILRQTGTTAKQAASMALLMIADRLAGECLFSGEKPLTASDIKPFVKAETAIDVAERGYQYIRNLIAANAIRFDNPGYGEVWGKIEDGICTFNKDVLIEKLMDGGFNFDAIKKKWADSYYLVRNCQGRYFNQTSVGGIKAMFVDIVIDDEVIQRKKGDIETLPF